MSQINTLNKSLEVLGLKTASKRVLEALVNIGTASAADIAAVLNMPKSSVYDALYELTNKSLAVEYIDNNGKTFSIPDQDQLARIHQNKINEIQNAHENLLIFLKNKNKRKNTARPRVKFYSGVEGIRQAFRDIPWSKKYSEAYLMWPTKDMLDLLGEEFLFEHRKPGRELGVIVNVIERESDRKLHSKHQWLSAHIKENLNQKRYLPDNIKWHMSYWIYGDKCLFASGGMEKVAFTIQSKEFADLQKIMWQQMWKISKP